MAKTDNVVALQTESRRAHVDTLVSELAALDLPPAALVRLATTLLDLAMTTMRKSDEKPHR